MLWPRGLGRRGAHRRATNCNKALPAVRGRLVNRKRQTHFPFGASLRDLGDLAPILGLCPRLRWFAPPGLLGVGMGRALGRGRR